MWAFFVGYEFVIEIEFSTLLEGLSETQTTKALSPIIVKNFIDPCCYDHLKLETREEIWKEGGKSS